MNLLTKKLFFKNQIKALSINIDGLKKHPLQTGTSFSFYPGGGLTKFLRVGQNMKKKIFCRQKHKKSLFFKFKGGGKCPPCLPPNDVPTYREPPYIQHPL